MTRKRHVPFSAGWHRCGRTVRVLQPCDVRCQMCQRGRWEPWTPVLMAPRCPGGCWQVVEEQGPGLRGQKRRLSSLLGAARALETGDYLEGSSVRGIPQVRTLEWGAIPFSRGSSRPRDRTHISCISCTGVSILKWMKEEMSKSPKNPWSWTFFNN